MDFRPRQKSSELTILYAKVCKAACHKVPMCSEATTHDVKIETSRQSNPGHLQVTFDFLHELWAECFLSFLQKNNHEIICHPELITLPHNTHVKLVLPKAVVDVKFRKAEGERKDQYIFEFEDGESAQSWKNGLGRFGLLELDPCGTVNMLAFPLVWSHSDFALALGDDGNAIWEAAKCNTDQDIRARRTDPDL